MRTQSHSRDSARRRRSEGWCRAAAAPSLIAEERGEHAEHTEACKPGEGTARLPTDFARILFTLSRKGNTWRIAGCRPDADRPNPPLAFRGRKRSQCLGRSKRSAHGAVAPRAVLDFLASFVPFNEIQSPFCAIGGGAQQVRGCRTAKLPPVASRQNASKGEGGTSDKLSNASTWL